MPSRRSALRSTVAFAIGCALTTHSFAEDAHDTIVAMGRYLRAVVQLFSGANGRVDGIEVAALDLGDRNALRAELEALVRALDTLLAPKGIFIQDLRGYIELAQANQFDSAAHRETAWKAIQGVVEEIAKAAEDVLAIVTRPDSRLNVIISDADRLELETTMRQRGILFRRFPDIPPPAKPGELSALEIMVEQHEKLRKITQRFRQTLEGKRRILTA